MPPSNCNDICRRAWDIILAHPLGVHRMHLARLLFEESKNKSDRVHHLLLAMEAQGYRIAEDDQGYLTPCYAVIDWPWDHAQTRRAQIVARRLP